MRNGKRRTAPVFRPRRFWPSALWVLFLAAGSVFSCVFDSFPFFTASLVAAFIGLNEAGRWPYKTNLVLCAGAAVVVAVAGVFSWLEAASVFALFFTISAYLFYFRDRAKRLIPSFEAFAAGVAQAADYGAFIDRAWEELQSIAPDEAVFIILAKEDGSLYIPAHFGEAPKRLKRNGGTPWKVYASGKPMVVDRVSTAHDQPMDRDAASIVSVPLSAHGEKLGVLQLESASSGAFTQEDAAKLSLAAMILAHELYMFEIESTEETDDYDSD